jgi:hypothetical protein
MNVRLIEVDELPDAAVVPSEEKGHSFLVANKRARRELNKHFEKPRPVWRQAEGGDLSSPRYRSLEIENGPVLAAMMWALHDAGMRAMFWCEGCQHLHLVDDERARQFKFLAVSGAEGVMPPHERAQ